MTDPRANEPTELIYLPESSWAPALAAAGLAGVLAGLIVWWPYAVFGAVVGLLAIAGWVRGSRRDFTRLPRRQRAATAALPVTPLRRSRDS